MRLVVVGSSGRLGRALMAHYDGRPPFEVLGLSRRELDLGRPESISQGLVPLEFDTLLLTAAATDVDDCERNEENAYKLNASAPERIARICQDKRARMIHFSTDFVFDGAKDGPYTEEDEPNPLSVYGQSKLCGERRVLETGDAHLVVRLSWLFGSDRPGFPEWILGQACKEGRDVSAPEDKIGCPSFSEDMARYLEPLVEKPIGGTVHLCNPPPCTWREWAQCCLDVARENGVPLKCAHVAGSRLSAVMAFVAKRPPNSALSTEKYTALTGMEPRSWREATREYLVGKLGV